MGFAFRTAHVASERAGIVRLNWEDFLTDVAAPADQASVHRPLHFLHRVLEVIDVLPHSGNVVVMPLAKVAKCAMDLGHKLLRGFLGANRATQGAR